jgi:Na+/H+ antiporter NhaD/arsenite permease-like protein
LIGGSIASSVFRKRVHVGFLAAIAAASNAGGAGSVVGDTTTTMMWIDGVSAPSMLHAFIGSLAAFAFFGVIGAWQQHRHEPMHDARESVPKVDWARLAIVLGILLGAVASNLAFDFPAAGVWAAILIGGVFRKPDWGEVRAAVKGSVFLVALVFAASLLPVASLPPASWGSALVLGVVSAFFGSLPLTKLALEQGGYDWGFLAFAVGFGGSMIWFGSAAGVALAGRFPEAKSARNWVWKGWHLPVGYVAGCLAILALSGWQPLIHKPARGPVPSPADSPPAGHHRNGTSGQNVAEAP